MHVQNLAVLIPKVLRFPKFSDGNYGLERSYPVWYFSDSAK